jgi:general secretion pathway protein K
MDQVVGRHDQAQARQLARGAVDWARNVLAEDASRSNVDHLGEAWAVKVPPTPVEEGEVSGELQDLSGRINLNKLVQIDGPTLQERDQFLRLLKLLGVGLRSPGSHQRPDRLARPERQPHPARRRRILLVQHPAASPQPGQRAAGQRW